MAFFHQDPQLHSLGSRVLQSIWAEFPAIGPEQVALTWLVYDSSRWRQQGGLNPMELRRRPVRGFSHRGRAQIYPASVVKLFYLVAVQVWLAQGRLQASGELERATRDMIVDSSNDATGLVVDLLTDTTSGPALPAAEFAVWQAQRNRVNDYFQSLGWEELTGINVNQKTWCDGAYGRERAFLGAQFENRNRLTTEATARLIHSLVGGAVGVESTPKMMALLERSLKSEDLAADPENQVTGFLGEGLPQGARLWSKAGWMSQVRHDAAYVELPDTLPYLLVAFTEGPEQSRNEKVLPFISQQVVKAIRMIK